MTHKILLKKVWNGFCSVAQEPAPTISAEDKKENYPAVPMKKSFLESHCAQQGSNNPDPALVLLHREQQLRMKDQELRARDQEMLKDSMAQLMEMNKVLLSKLN